MTIASVWCTISTEREDNMETLQQDFGRIKFEIARLNSKKNVVEIGAESLNVVNNLQNALIKLAKKQTEELNKLIDHFDETTAYKKELIKENEERQIHINKMIMERFNGKDFID